MKTSLVNEIQKTINLLAITQKDASMRMNISQPKISTMLRGNYNNISEGKLMDCLLKLGCDIEIVITQSKTPLGHIIVTSSN